MAYLTFCALLSLFAVLFAAWLRHRAERDAQDEQFIAETDGWVSRMRETE